jgi:hypothetical protein
MTWTTEKPTVAGWYWYRDNHHEYPFAIEITWVCGELETMDDHFDHKVSDLTGEWSSHPITPPREGEAR